jgi:hypothetical protein
MFRSSYPDLYQRVGTEPVRVKHQLPRFLLRPHLSIYLGRVQSIFASGLTVPGDVAFDGAGNLFVADNANSNIQGSIYKYAPNGSRVTFAMLDPSDRQQTWLLIARAICTWRIWAATSIGTIWEFYVGILEEPLVPCRTAHKAWFGTAQAICFW